MRIAQALRETPFDRLYRRHVRDVYGFALGTLGDARDAEDVTQTTFLNAYRALERGERIDNPRAWLLAIAHNVCRQRFRTAARRPQEVALDPEAAEAVVGEDAGTPSLDELRTALGQLAFNQRTVLVLREIEGLSYVEVAETMGLTVAAVETLLFRARRALREQLEAADRPLSCSAAEQLVSLSLDSRLPREDRGLLRAHLRVCGGCASLARRQRARKSVMPALAALPLPASLAKGLTPAGLGLGAKIAAVTAAASLVGTAGVVAATEVAHRAPPSSAAKAAVAGPTPAESGFERTDARSSDADLDGSALEPLVRPLVHPSPPRQAKKHNQHAAHKPKKTHHAHSGGGGGSHSSPPPQAGGGASSSGGSSSSAASSHAASASRSTDNGRANGRAKH